MSDTTTPTPEPPDEQPIKADLDLRSRLLQKAADVPEETIEVADEKVLVRGMLTRDTADLMARAAEGEGGGDLSAMFPQFVVFGAHDPDTGKRLFTLADIDAIMSLPAAITNTIATTTMRLSGLTEEAQKTAGKASVSTDGDEPSTS